ncbi:MAG: zinc-ribbon domain containing protein [Bacillota bacterium]|nr:zinc-ribbon domain containing protein [Bacillota bacterium]
MYTDKNLSCRDCGNEFVFSASEQEFYASKGFENEPSRCSSCREINKRQRSGQRGGSFSRSPREMFKATCARCGKVAEVPFKPTGEKPVYCKDCYQPSRSRF